MGAYTVGSSAPAVAAPVIPPQVLVANPSVAAPLPVIAPQPQVYAAPAPVAAARAPVVAQPQVYYAQAPIAPSVISPVVVPSYMGGHAHHAQDEFGQYQYGYTNEDSTKLEQRMADGSVRGTYSYIDANGVVQRVDYISDGLGFRVAATNLPSHGPEVAAAAAPVEAAPIAAPVPAEKVVSGFVVPSVGTYADLVKPAPAGPMYHVAAPIAPSVLASTPAPGYALPYAAPHVAYAHA